METATVRSPAQPVVYEYMWYGFDFGAYLQALGLPPRDIQSTLKITYNQLHSWREQGRVPRAVATKMFNQWGRYGVVSPSELRVQKPVRLHMMYADSKDVVVKNLVTAPAPPPEPKVELPPVPDSVPWAVHSHTVNILQHHNSNLIRQICGYEEYIKTLETALNVRRADSAMEKVLGVLDQTERIRSPEIDGLDEKISKAVRDNLQLLSHQNGNGGVVTDLERKVLSFRAGPRG